MRHILVTGGCGYAGTALVHDLARRGMRVGVLDDLRKGRIEGIGHLIRSSSDVVFQQVDIRRTDDVIAYFRSNGVPDDVVHLAAKVDAASSHEQANDLLCQEINHQATLTLAEAAKDAGVARFIYQSSTSVYGKTSASAITEDEPPRPVSPYGITKLAGEAVLELHAEQFRVTVLRPATLFGWSPGFRYELPINKFQVFAFFGIPFAYHEQALKEYRPYLSIGDWLEAVDMALSMPELAGRVWNVSSLDASMADVLAAITEVYPRMSASPVTRDSGQALSFMADTSSIRALGFSPTATLVDEFRAVRRGLKSLSDVSRGVDPSDVLT